MRSALILGSANCLRDDLERALDLGEFDCVIACKGAGLIWSGSLAAWVSLHPERLPGDIARRQARGFPPAERTYGHKPVPGVSHHMNYRWPDQKTSGSSGLFALRVAIEEFGCDRNVLCGIPLDKSLGRVDGLSHWPGAMAFKRGWEETLPIIRDKARSMSGWTRNLLGEPTTSWLYDEVGN